jgi:carbamoylphosphate synthase large subunit
MKTVIVTGVGGPAGRSVSELLMEHGYRVVAVDMQPLIWDQVDFYQVPAASEGDYMEVLHQLAQRENPTLIVPTVTEELPILATGWRWENEFPLLLSPARGIEIANDKYLTCQELSAKNINVPRFALPSQISSAVELADRIGWPCITKPRVGRGGRGVTVRYEKDFRSIQKLDDGFILQEFAPGIDYAPNVYIRNSRQSVAVVLEKTELKEGLVGNAKSVIRVSSHDVEDLAVKAAQALELRGPIDVDIRRRGDGSPVVLEVNARFGANIRFAPEIFDNVIEEFLQ